MLTLLGMAYGSYCCQCGQFSLHMRSRHINYYAGLVVRVRLRLEVSFMVSVGVKVIKQASLPCIAGTTSNCKSTGGDTSTIFLPGIADIVSYKFYGN